MCSGIDQQIPYPSPLFFLSDQKKGGRGPLIVLPLATPVEVVIAVIKIFPPFPVYHRLLAEGKQYLFFPPPPPRLFTTRRQLYRRVFDLCLSGEYYMLKATR